MTTYNWKTAADGDWATAGSWTPSGPPNATTADAVIGLAGSYTASVAYSSAYTLDSLKLSGSGATLDVQGTLALVGAKTVTVSAGTLSLDSGGTIKGATISRTGGTIFFNSGTLDGVTYRGTLDLSASGSSLSVINGITLTGTAGTGAGAIAIGDYSAGVSSSVNIFGSTTLDNATITLAYGQLVQNESSGTGDVLTLGAGLTLQDGGYATLYENSYAAIGVINKGKILASTSGGQFSIQGPGFSNQGTIAVSNGDRLIISTTTFSNSGTLTVSAASATLYTGWSNTGKIIVSNGGTLTLGSDYTTAWGSVGSISATASTVNLYGQFTTAKLKTLVLSNDSISIYGQLVNTGTTLAVGGASSLGTLGLGGTITGGVIADAGSGFLFSGATLDGVTYRGTLDLSAESSSVKIANGIVLTGTAGTGAGTVNIGAFSTMAVLGNTTLDNATVTLSGYYSYSGLIGVDSDGSGTTLTLGSHLIVRDALVNGYSSGRLGAANYDGDLLVNKGTILAGTAGAYFGIDGQSFTNQGTIAVSNGDSLIVSARTFSNTGTVTANAASLTLYAGWSNTGKIIVSNGGTLQLGSDTTTAWGSIGSISATASTVKLYGQFTTAKLKTIVLSSDTVSIYGLLVNTGTTLAVGGSSSLGIVGLNGTITGGVIADAGSGFLFSGATLDGVTYRGTLDLSAESSSVKIANGIVLTGTAGTGAGTVNIGAFSTMAVLGNTTLDNATVTLSGYYSYSGLIGVDSDGSGTTLTLGSHLIVRDALVNGYSSGRLGAANYDGDLLVNKGTILAGTAGAYFGIDGQSFTNQGTIAVSNGDSLIVSARTFSNTGTVTANAASLTLYAGWSNTGKIIVSNGGTLQLGSDTTTAWGSIGSISATASTVKLYGQFTTAKLKTIVLSSDTVSIYGLLVNTGTTLAVGGSSSLGIVGLNGTITGGVIADAGSGFLFSGATLDGMTYRGTLDLSAESSSVTIANGITLTGTAGIGIGAIALGNFSQAVIIGTTTLDNATITLGTSGNYGYGLTSQDADGSGVTLTLGSHLVVQDYDLGSYLGGYIGAGGYVGDSVVSKGTILAGINGGYFNIGGNSFTNQGTIGVSNGDSLFISTTVFTNLSSTTLSGGTYSVTGTSTLDLGTDRTVSTLSASLTLSGAGSTVRSYKSSTGTYVTLESTLSSVSSSGKLSVLGSRGYSTTKTVTDSGQILLNGGTFASAGTLTVAATGTLMGYGVVKPAVANSGLLYAQGGTLAITGAVSGGGAWRADTNAVLQLNQAAPTSIAGKVTLNGAGSVIRFGTATPFTTLESSVTAIASTGTLAVLGGRGFVSTNTLTDSGVFNIAGGTFSIASLVVAAGGRIIGKGTIANAVTNAGTIESNAGLLKLSAGASGAGALIVDAASTLELAATTSAGTISVGGVLKLDGSTYTGATAVLTGGRGLGKGTLASAVANAGTIESNGGLLKLSGSLSGAGALLVDAASTLELATTASAGTISVGGVLKLDGATYTGASSLLAGGKVLGKGTLASAVANAGTIESNGGLLKLSGSLSGTGALLVDAASTLELANTASAGTITDNGILQLDGKTTSAAATTIGAAGIVRGYGTLGGTVADAGTIDAKGGLLKLSGAVSGAGKLLIENAATLELGAACSASVTFVSGAVGSLKLDAQGSFTGGIGGLALGDGVVFSNETLSSATVSGGTLTVVGSAGTVNYAVSGALTGNHFAIQSDLHTIKLVAGAAGAAAGADLVPPVGAAAWTMAQPASAGGLGRWEPPVSVAQLGHF